MSLFPLSETVPPFPPRFGSGNLTESMKLSCISIFPVFPCGCSDAEHAADTGATEHPKHWSALFQKIQGGGVGCVGEQV